MIDKRIMITELSTTSFAPKMKATVTQKVNALGKKELDRVDLVIGAFDGLSLGSERERYSV